jgi:DNA-binding NarL/FixJ family response regulator
MLDRLASARSVPGNGSLAARAHLGPRRHRERTTVLVVDADEIMRLGVRAVLGSDKDLHVIGDAETVTAAAKVAASLRPSVAIVTGALPDGGVLDVCSRVRDAAPGTRVMILARHLDGASVVDAVRAGAVGYFTQHIGRQELCRAVRAIASGETLIDSASTRVLIDGIRRGAARSGRAETAPLAVQERRVLALVAQGKTNKEIAAELTLSDKTVKNYLSHAFEKLNVTRRAQAAVLFSQAHGAVHSTG